MSIKLSDSIRVGQQKPLEDKYFNELVPYTSTSQVNTLLPEAIRHRGLTVNINGEEYWYKDGIDDENLVFKSNQKTIEVNIWELKYDLIYQKKLEPGRLYKITLVEGWCFSGHLIKAIYLKAITNNTLESEGVGEFYTPKYNTSDSNLGIWKGELLANGMISSASYNIGDKVIWGNLFWENISGNIGSNEKEVENSYSLKIDNYLSESDWRLITPNDDESLYNIQFDYIKYDIENNYINYRADNLGNVYEISYSNLLNIHPNFYFAVIKDPTFIYYLNAISLFQWGRDNVYNNIINESFVQNCNYNPTAFYDNTFESSRMHENNFLNVSIIRNDFKNASIVSNYLKNYGGILYNNLDNSSINSNRYYFEIRSNTLKNYSSISNNNDNNIIVNDRSASIINNILDNECTISNNTFVEEGTGISGHSKGINDNTMTTYCNINNNTIKNGSRIFGHTMNYYSTINGNTLDTDSNIYNNQLVQNGKIDNNILTGHGRIYGNQLDRLSEITLCKLRISPATSYATTMKNNRLFTGKIQNVDFGNIVNPVGSNPNDPAFGGNGLSECIIENNSIIKDLTFPNNGGIGIQFVKMNGYSEFKNITVNNPIRNVDFINTIFNETSDYSKLIEGSGYQTAGFTKTYIDNILLQDRFDEKQDVLTEDNVGQFMDVKLSTKSTPTSGDTVLGRDSLTGKAVEIPTSSLGGNGNVDTSNLVPYTGANKDVNIASNYFKTSKGFDFTFDVNNYFNTYHSDYYSTLKFKSKDSSDDNFGYLQITANAEEGFTVNCVDGNEANTNFLQVNINGISSSKVFESGEGFKTPFGTSNQALTADGGVFDLNTKADIDDIPTKTSFTHDILVANWTLVSGKYEAVISNAGILADSFVDVIPSNDNVDIVRNAQIYPSVLISAGSVKVYSKFLPSGTISVTVNVI